MIITNTLILSDGSQATNLFMTVNIHTEVIEATGMAPVDLNFWRSEQDKNDGKSNVWPVDTNDNKITNCTLQFTGTETVKASGKCTLTNVFTFFKQAAADKLNSLYGWNITL